MSDERYTSGSYADQNPDWHASGAALKAEAVASLVEEAGIKPTSVLDVGCGTGGVLAALQERWPSVSHLEGWDIAEEAISRAGDVAGLSLHVGNVLEHDASADLVLCLDVFEHVPDDHAFLTALSTRGRWFVFRIPLDLSALDVARPKRLNSVRDQYGHLHVYTRETALQLLEAAGYRVRAEAYHRVPPEVRGLGRLTDLLRRVGVVLAPHASVRWLGGHSLMVLAERRA